MADREIGGLITGRKRKDLEGEIASDPDGDVVMQEDSGGDKKKKGEESGETNHLAYICRSTYINRRSVVLDWYVADTKAGTLERDADMSTNTLLNHCGCALSGSKLYAVGGVDTSDECWSTAVNVFDTAATGTLRKWQAITPMSGPRVKPLVVPIGEKIYVFGSSYKPASPWAEYYDPSDGKGKWVILPDPPTPVTKTVVHYSGGAVYGNGDYVILWSRRFFCLFDVHPPHNWQYIDAPYTMLSPTMPPSNVLVVDNILYWCFGNVYKFDLTMKEPFDNPVHIFSELDTVFPDPEICLHGAPYILATGNDQLSIIWFSNIICEDKVTSRVHYSNFQVSVEGLTLGGTSHFDINESFNCAVVGVNWSNHVERKHDLRDQISDPKLLLEKLSCTLHKINFNAFWGTVRGEMHGCSLVECDGKLLLQGEEDVTDDEKGHSSSNSEG